MINKQFYIFIYVLVKAVSSEIPNNNDVIYNTNLTRCNMYSPFCNTIVFVKKELKTDDLIIKSSD
jgi:hypothetical protein